MPYALCPCPMPYAYRTVTEKGYISVSLKVESYQFLPTTLNSGSKLLAKPIAKPPHCNNIFRFTGFDF